MPTGSIVSRRAHVIYTFQKEYTRCGAIFPGTFVPVLTSEGKCLRRRAKPAHLGGHLPVRAQIAHDQVMRDLQAQRRKADSDAVSPFFAQIRAEAHFRWHALARLRQHYREVVAQVEAGKATLPGAFSYEELRYKQRFHFLLWDRPSFVLGHSQSYSKTLCSTARNKRQQYSPSRNHFFLEFVGAESLIDPNAPREPDALLWFGELLRSRLIGEHANCGTPEEIERKQAFLRSWGYGEREDEEFATQPFSTGQTGLLTETRIGGQANFLTAARRKTSGLLFTIETLYDAATFGLAALDFFTTTGARANELLSFVSVLIASMRCRWEELPVCWSDWSQREEINLPIT